MRLPLYWIDAFASAAFSGNPAAVVPLDRWLPDSLMQQIAFENGLAETAFIVPISPSVSDSTGAAEYDLRWFTPKVEVDLCGHATLAAGHVLLKELGHAGESVTFQSRSGKLLVSKRDDKLELDFPATPVAAETDPATTDAIARAIGQRPIWTGRSIFDRFAVLANAAEVSGLRPNLEAVSAAGGRGLIVTAEGEEPWDFVSRFFAPQSGVPEDPVTGSAHSALAPFWAARLGRPSLRARQISPRGGERWCEVVSRPDGESRVKIAGHATLYLRGEITVPGR
jgi:PhzF family phenazine biosynthesis protein